MEPFVKLHYFFPLNPPPQNKKTTTKKKQKTKTKTKTKQKTEKSRTRLVEIITGLGGVYWNRLLPRSKTAVTSDRIFPPPPPTPPPKKKK